MRRKRLSIIGGGRSSRSFGGAQLFTQLADEPGNYTGAGGKFVVVNVAETALEFIPLPPLAITNTFVVNSQVAMLALVAQTGDVAIRTDINQTYILQGTNPAVLGDWALLLVSPTHALAGPLHTADTITNLNTKLSDGSLITTKAAEIAALAAKANPTISDLLMIEDVADTQKKKQVTIGSLPMDMLTPIMFYPAPQTTNGTAGMLCILGAADMPAGVLGMASATVDGPYVSVNVIGYGTSYTTCHIFLYVPSQATNIIFRIFNNPAGIPGAGKNVLCTLFGRAWQDASLPTAWSAGSGTLVPQPATRIWQYSTIIKTIATLGLVGGVLNQICIARHGTDASDTLAGMNWQVQSVRVSFS